MSQSTDVKTRGRGRPVIRSLDDETKKKILQLKQAGKINREIELELGLTTHYVRSTIRDFWKNAQF